jgi:hypothetical protein
MDLISILGAIPGAAHVLPYVTTIIALCAALAVALPRPGAGATGLYPVLYAMVNFIALNFGRARNSDGSAGGPGSSAPASASAPVVR